PTLYYIAFEDGFHSTNLCSHSRFFLSNSSLVAIGFAGTPATTTGPAKGPRPASSIPQIFKEFADKPGDRVTVLLDGLDRGVERHTDLNQGALDLEMLAEAARNEKVGPIHVKVEDVFDIPTNNQIISEDLKKLIDEEVKRILDEAQEKAKKLILENKDKVENLAKALLEKETLTEEEIEKIFGVSQEDIKKVGKKIEKKEEKNEENR
ncbi:MAG TPA: hypothetical protein EYP03_02205, partial [Aquificae bacterium]|nr:hypothetical protein [Aquificota bacterium]